MLFRPRRGRLRGGGDAHLREVQRLAAWQQPQEDRDDRQPPVVQFIKKYTQRSVMLYQSPQWELKYKHLTSFRPPLVLITHYL